ncbi:DUF4032 domain-containing protein [Spirillospora sp. NPDC048819]|uniref:DUF4032 domain-containing protein n=1 Tax=Spirillospora sp. NPDC048819 TaxID=3155268 RepID=UPI0033ED15FF
MAGPGHHRAVLTARTGLNAPANQARRLLNDIADRGHLERVRSGRRGGRFVPRI